MGGLQLRTETLVFSFVESEVSVVQRRLLRAAEFASDEVGNVGKLERLVQRDEIRLDFSGPHQPNAGQEHAIDVEERFYPARRLLKKQFPLGLGEAEIMVRVVPG